MKSSRYIILLFIILIFLIGRLLIPYKNQQAFINNSPSPTITTTPGPTNSVSALSASDSKCHVIKVDATDPQAYLPDPNCTPGVIDPTVTQDNLATTVCRSGYTTTIRPPSSYTNALKKQQILEYGYIDTNMSNYEEDHFISLELGGSPKDPKNLWPEPHPSYNEKDKVESYLHKKLCAGEITLLQAQQEIRSNWYEIYKQIK